MAGAEQSMPLWALFKNPVFQRYTRSRLRARALIPWMLMVGILSTFVFLLIWVGGTSNGADTVVLGRVILIVMIPVQALILMLIGTGAVASGIMLEGAALSSQMLPLGILGLWAVVSFVLALRWFRWG